jgi:hypothetical protein
LAGYCVFLANEEDFEISVNSTLKSDTGCPRCGVDLEIIAAALDPKQSARYLKLLKSACDSLGWSDLRLSFDPEGYLLGPVHWCTRVE